ncbi:MAG TPA: hypothetical protein VD978_23605 [Azospirillum sp.]|nr:hypothetical protein [Azospirillum sp.]
MRVLPAALVLGAMLLNFGLCFLKTTGMTVGTMHVAGVELVILSAAAALAWRGVSGTQLGAIIGVLVYIGAMRILNPDLDLKIARDLAIPFLFWTLGVVRGTPQDGDRLVYVAVPLVFAVGLFEFLALDTYQQLFDILGYYIDKGAVEADQTTWMSTRLFANGIRPAGDGRTLFPFLGEHRVSSIFLEPVSTGNFGAIAFLWLLHRWSERPWLNSAYMGIVFICIVLADARFGAMVCAIATFAYLVPLTRHTRLAFVLPFAVVALLFGKAALNPAGIIDNGFGGRLLGSGILLMSWGPAEWFALAPSPIDTADSGYGYLISNLGILPAIALWTMLIFRRGLPDEATAFRTSIAIYAALSLSISGSMFTIKTAALLWFLYGTLCPAQPTEAVTGIRETARTRLSWASPRGSQGGARA